MTMPSRNSQSTTRGKRSLLDFSDEKRRDTLLRTAWNQIVSGFKSKPEPKSTWYETASGDVTPWRLVVNPIRAAIIQAVESGDKELIDATLQGARAFCHELEADFYSLVPSEAEQSVIQIALEETGNEGPANEVEMALVQSPSPTAAERAIGPLTHQLASLVQLVNACRRLARETQPRRAW